MPSVNVLSAPASPVARDENVVVVLPDTVSSVAPPAMLTIGEPAVTCQSPSGLPGMCARNVGVAPASVPPPSPCASLVAEESRAVEASGVTGGAELSSPWHPANVAEIEPPANPHASTVIAA